MKTQRHTCAREVGRQTMAVHGGYASLRTARLGVACIAGIVLLLAGCEAERTQSSLHPAGPAASLIAELWWFMFVVLAGVFVLVMAVAAWAVFRPRMAAERPTMGNGFIVAGGVALPSVVLLALLIYSLTTTLHLRTPETAITIEVIGHKWWWEVRYPEQGLVTANEIRIPAGEPVLLKLSSGDVVHSFWVPQLHGKMDLLPEHENTFWIEADEAGVFRGQCAEYCGEQHARMAFYVVAMEREDFMGWVAQRQPDPPEPTTPVHRRGRDVFFAAGCNACHAIRGTRADGDTGPDLTHMGSRLSIGAGQWPNTTGGLAGWISNPQALKPGNQMPRSYLEPDDLHALVTYLQSLD